MKSTLVFFAIVPFVLADRLSYLDEACDPYYVGRDFPKLISPQWVGEQGVEAVVILSIDDMREAAKYESFLRPILDRLKEIDGRAPVSIFTNRIDTTEPQLQAWLEEGLSLEVHTVDHPCPLLKDGDFAKSLSTYQRCVDMMAAIPNNQPVAFRMPCCDSLNTPSPRFYAEIFNPATPKGNYLAIDSSVFNIFTADDPELPASITTNEQGEPRFRSYLPFPSFVNTIENYPYPYIIAGRCWEFPCVVPSDWEAQNLQQPNNPDTVRDLEKALDATVIKQGVMPIVFHPHGWIRNQQLVEFIDYAVQTYGRKVKFLTFREALQRINLNLLGGRSLREDGGVGQSQSIALIDLNDDGFVDVVVPGTPTQTRVWNPIGQQFDVVAAPFSGSPQVLLRDGVTYVSTVGPDGGFSCYRLSGQQWSQVDVQIDTSGLPDSRQQWMERAGQGGGYRWRDLDSDGDSELLLTHGTETMLLGRSPSGYRKLPFDLPVGTRLNTQAGGDAGFRFRDLNGDGQDDIVFSNGQNFSVHLFKNKKTGWETTRSGSSQQADAIPAIVRTDGTNNGAWFHSGHLWIQNEYTNRLPDLVDRVAFKDLLQKSEADSNPLGTARSLQESLDSFTLIDGHIEVVAAEPQIEDPVAFDWGHDGKLWVVEMRDYPNGAQWHGPGDPKGDPGGRVKVLEDLDKDGFYEKATVFLDELPSPNGIQVWRNGVLVTAGSEILYAEDTDHDNKADVRRALYRGLNEGNQQHRANGLRWGLDHWLHLANGDSGGNVVSLKTKKQVNIRGRDFRITPDEGGIELTSGQTQFGRSRDNDGNWFGGNNSNPVWHYALEDKYLGRNPFFAPPSSRHQIAEFPGAAPVFPTSQTLERFNDFDRADRFTSACSPEVFRAPSLVDPTNETRGNFVYVCEPVHNLVHRSAIFSDGATFLSKRREDEQQNEFLSSSDNWFRPVMCRTGPDASLWIADMYRMVIEHPEWIPMDWQKRIDHLAGSDRGRIYRVVFPTRDSAGESWTTIRAQPTRRLVDWLSSDNGVFRDMVQQELYWRADDTAVEALRSLFNGEDSPALVPALYLLEHWNALDPELLGHELRSDSALRARHALRLAEPRCESSPELRRHIIELARSMQNHPISPLKQQLAYTLGEVPGDEGAMALADIGIADGHDPFMRAAVMSSVTPKNVATVVEAVLRAREHAAPHVQTVSTDLIEDLTATAVGSESQVAVQGIVSAIAAGNAQEIWQLSAFAALLKAGETHDVELLSLLDASGQKQLEQLIAHAVSIVRNIENPEPTRLMALKAFGQDPTSVSQERETLLTLISPTSSHTLQVAAIRKLGSMNDPGAIKGILQNWRSLTPTLRANALDVLLGKRERLSLLMDAIEDGTVLAVQVSTQHQQQLLRHRSSNISQRARKLFAMPETDRAAVVQEYAVVSSLTGNPEQGRGVFQKQCSACHSLGGIGNSIGPDLMALSDKSTPAMLVAILDPNRAVEEKYLDYKLLTTNGQLLNGLLLEESSTSVTLAAPNGEQQTVLRSRIEELVASQLSLMPDGLEKVLAPQDMADVISFVQSFRLPRKQFAGNEPQIAPVRDDGSIRLFAMHAEIYGPSLVFEPKYRNLGFWASDRDRAVWTVDAPKAGQYSVRLDYACPPQPAANRFRLTVNGQQLGGEVVPSASWDEYRSMRIGFVKLSPGPVQLTFESDGPIGGFLLDLRTIMLYPD